MPEPIAEDQITTADERRWLDYNENMAKLFAERDKHPLILWNAKSPPKQSLPCGLSRDKRKPAHTTQPKRELLCPLI